MVIVDRDHIKELYSAGDDELSFVEASKQFLQPQYIFQSDFLKYRFHIKPLKVFMSRQVPNAITDIIEEIGAAFDDEMDVGEGTILSTV